MLEKQNIIHLKDVQTLKDAVKSFQAVVASYERHLDSIEKELIILRDNMGQGADKKSILLEIEKQKTERQKRRQEEKLLEGFLDILTR